MTLGSFNWNTCTCRMADHAPDCRITIANDWAPIGDYGEAMQDAPLSLYEDLLSTFAASDWNIVNVECALCSTDEPIIKDGPNLRGDPGAADHLAKVPFHAAVLANNHTSDFGLAGLRETIHALSSAGLETVGAGACWEDAARPLVRRLGSSEVAVVACAEGEECRSRGGGHGSYGFDREVIRAQVRRLKSEGRFVIVISHMGYWCAPCQPPSVVAEARGLADAGADVVVISHSHAPQGLEIHAGVPIIYGMGNFLFCYGGLSQYAATSGYLCHFDLSGGKLLGFGITPYVLRENGVHLMKGPLREQFLSDLAALSGGLETDSSIQMVWQGLIAKLGGAEAVVAKFKRALDGALDGDRRSFARFANYLDSIGQREFYVDSLRLHLHGNGIPVEEWVTDIMNRWHDLSWTEAEQIAAVRGAIGRPGTQSGR
jgi:hypothetical protein